MRQSFQLVALPYEQFEPLFKKTDEELLAMGARRMVANSQPGFPCRVSLEDAEIGEVVILLHFTHHDVPTPYRSTGPIFVREHAITAKPAPNEIPVMLQHRLLSVRGYDPDGMLTTAKVIAGRYLDATIRQFFEDETVAYLHVHNATPGCYNCAVRRA